jgi:glycosyltransferase involved in cell wall biosynthesis
MIKKKIVAINTDYPILKTGLARNGRLLAEWLHKTGKYEIVYYACGCPWSNPPEYERFPYKIVGTLPNDPHLFQEIQKDPGLAREASYGAYNIEKFVKEVRPDVLILSNDSWSFQQYISKKFWNKVHCIPHITLDSLPFLPDQKKLIESSKKMYVWADFAKKEAERLGYNNVDVLTGIIDNKRFFKLPRYKKLELRKKSNIPEDAFICGYVFRNQLRKELLPLLEGYVMFKKQNPEIKNTYLLLHTHWNEPAGWDIVRLCEDCGVNKSEILTTYVCRNCREYEVKPFAGQDLDCRFCGIKGSPQSGQFTCNVACGVTEEQLNEVYNLMDCYAHPFNAGGLEIPLVESLYTELPLATVPYSSGEMFTDQGFVEKIDFAWTVQIGTQFRRAAPYASSVAKFLKKIHQLPPQEREKLGKRGREWALSRFSPEVVCKQWEKILDDLPDHNWDFNTNDVAKDPNAAIPNTDSNEDWVKSLYNNILKCDPDVQGFQYWLNLLKGGSPRQDIERTFRSIAYSDNQKLGISQQKFEDKLDKTGRKRFLIVAKESIGDLLYVTALLESFKESYPDYDLYLACDPQYSEIFDGNKHLYKVIEYQPFMESEIACTGQGENFGYFDGYCHLTVSTQRQLNYLTHSKIALKLT